MKDERGDRQQATGNRDSCEVWEGRIVALLDGELGRTARVEAEAHLASCAGCRRFFSEVQAVYAGAEAENEAFAGDISAGVLERVTQEAMLSELRAMRAEMNALRQEVAGLREETSRGRASRGAEASGTFLMPYAPPSEGPSLLGIGERGRENKWN